jgi:hypothetical protein
VKESPSLLSGVPHVGEKVENLSYSRSKRLNVFDLSNGRGGCAQTVSQVRASPELFLTSVFESYF